MKDYKTDWNPDKLKRNKLNIIQINLGNKCNQVCTHCHVEASPAGKKNMQEDTANKIIEKLLTLDVKKIEFTGGAPEQNSNLKKYIEKLSKAGKEITVRTNLTVLDIDEYKFYIDLFKKNNVQLVSSLPSVFEDTTDGQRGKGVFESSIRILQKLNKEGFGSNGRKLDLVYNPDGDYLPPDKTSLDSNFRTVLNDKYNIKFNNLIAMVNTPIKRFRTQLEKKGKLNEYFSLLKKNFNIQSQENIMCRSLLSIDYEGYIYDCDFNLALRKKVKTFENKKFWEIDFNTFNPEISFFDYCYACSAGAGSSCQGTTTESINQVSTIQHSDNQTKEDNFKMLKDDSTKAIVKEYYGTVLQGTSDLKTTACCTTEAIPDHVKKATAQIADEILMKYYGCGSPMPIDLKDLKVLDIGCGTGRDVYIVSQLVGENGFCSGIDMTKNQLDLAKAYIDKQTKRFGYKKPNVAFVQDYMENLADHFEENSLDLVISNCVLNLAENKEVVLDQVYKVLKNGGEFYFSDVYADRRVPEEIKKDPVLYGECLGGALYKKDFERMCAKAGFAEPRIVSVSDIDVTAPEQKKLVGNIGFCSITYRLWKLEGLEDACEDYGHVAIYKGGIDDSDDFFVLDDGHTFYKNKPELVCGNTALMLSKTHYGKYFEIIGSFDEHFGEFSDCGTSVLPSSKEDSTVSSCGC